MKKAFFLIIFIIITCLIILPFKNYASDVTGDELKLYLGESSIISVNSPTRIAIGNPKVIDVISVSNKEITVVAKGMGNTTLVYWDNFGEQSYKVKVFLENTLEIKRRVDNLLAQLRLDEVYTKAEDEEGKVMLLGMVGSTQDKDRIALALGPLKDKTLDLIKIKEEESAIEIDVQILELNKDATNTLGLTWPGSLNLIEKGSPGISETGSKFQYLFKVLNLQRGTSTGASPFTFKLDALIQEGKARVLSRPRLACQSGKEAELLVGGEKPIMTTNVLAAGTTSTQVQYKEFGIKLKIKPTVTAGGRVKLDLYVEVSDVGEALILGATNAPTAMAFPLSKRTASTELYLNDGQTMAIGGLIKQKTEEDLRKFPWLADVPVLGMFFRQRTTKIGKGTGARDDTELFITLTPSIISQKEPLKDKKAIKPEIISPRPPEPPPTPQAAYASIIQKRILENLNYPDSAKQAGFQGTVKLSLHLSYQGELLEVKVKESSGYKIFDDQALNVAKGIASYPPFPPSIEQQELWVDIPITYRLD